MPAPLELPEIISRVAHFLPYDDRVSASLVSRTWQAVLRPILDDCTLVWEDTVDCVDTLPDDTQDKLLNESLTRQIRCFEANFTYFNGKAMRYHIARQTQLKQWAPFKDALKTQQQERRLWIDKLVFRYGNFPLEDLFPILIDINGLKHLEIDTSSGHPLSSHFHRQNKDYNINIREDREERDFVPDLTKLHRILEIAQGDLQTSLEKLTVKNAWWPNMGSPTHAQCPNLKALTLRVVNTNEPNVIRLVKCFPALEKLTLVEVLVNFSIPFWMALTTHNPKLKELVFSIAVATATAYPHKVKALQLEWMVSYLTVEKLTRVGFYRLQEEEEGKINFGVSQDLARRFLAKFKSLERLELYETETSVKETFEAAAKELGHSVKIVHVSLPLRIVAWIPFCD
ncbi:hypothetical protein BG004_007098 [Podila humilis]|nr:hypothetical protein BG004_007098 [Podila humilis]